MENTFKKKSHTSKKPFGKKSFSKKARGKTFGNKKFDNRPPSDTPRNSRKDHDNTRGRKDPTRGGNNRERFVSSRLGAFYLLEAVLVDKKPLEFVEHRTLKSMAPKDRGLARMIAYTALRHNIELDLMIKHFVDEDIFTPQVDIFIKVGLTQILYLDVPDHAAVSETINAVFGKALPSKGMINAILRRGVDEGQAFLNAHTDTINIPKYLWRSWVNVYGEKKARHILNVLHSQAPVDISVKSNPEHWAETLGGHVLPTGGVRLGKVGTLTKLDGFEDGAWWVQDMAAQIPVHIMGDIAGKNIIDLCAAPGGKTSQLLARGANVIAVDHNEFRLKRLQENMDRLGLQDTLEVVLCDAVKYKPKEKADWVLLDAPCSATGTIRKNPDLPFLKDDALIKSVAKLQAQMLEKAVGMVKDGGHIIFATCSLQPQEGEMHLDALPDDIKIAPIKRREMGDLYPCITPRGAVRTLPTHYGEHGGMDGFFIARFKKV